MEKALKELKQAIKAEETKCLKAIDLLKFKFAANHTRFKVGNIVEDRLGTHRLEKAVAYYDYGVPKLVFKSTQLRKSDLTEMKRPKGFTVYEDDNTKLIKR